MNFKQTALKAAKEAGKILSKYYCKNAPKKLKKDNSYVTKADVESTKIVRKIILGQFPDHSILDEELGHKKTKSKYTWIVDPLDGTHNFIMENPLFGVSIALEHNKEIILGVIYMPILKKLYYAEKGKGAFCNGKRISVSKTNTLKRCLMIFDAKLKKDTDMKVKLLKRLAPITWRTRIYGVAVYHNLLVAEGKSEINIDFDSHPWDHSAALLIVEEAGGKVTGIDGKKWNPYIKNYVSSNGKIHKKLLNVLKN